MLVLIGSAGILFAQETPWPMPETLPPLPNPEETTKPVPRIEWLQQVRSFFENARKEAPSIRLVFDGDSITRGWLGNGRPVWHEQYASLGAFNFAIGGDGAQHVLWRLSQGQLQGINPKLVVLMIGTNNIRQNTPENVAAGVTAVVREYRRQCPEAVILLLGILPRGEKPSDPLREKVRLTNQILAGLDDGEKILFQDIGAKFLEPDGSISAKTMPDFLHLAPESYNLWAEAIRPVIHRYISTEK